MLQQFRRNNNGGFTLVELMIVIAIVGILVTIALPNFLTYQRKGYNAAASIDIKKAYIAAQAYFTDYPTATISDVSTLERYGFTSSDHVTLTINTGTQDGLSMLASHVSGDVVYTVNSGGDISF